MSESGDAGQVPVSWKAIEADATVLSSEGDEVGQVAEVAGDSTADIFTGLVVSLGMLGANRFLPAERVTEIWPTRVQVDLSRAEIEALPEYEEPQTERWQPDTGAAGLFRRLFGRRRL